MTRPATAKHSPTLAFKGIHLLLLVCSWLATPYALAQTDESKQPIEISADSLISNEKSGLSTYRGNVVVKQGKITLNGDTVTVHHPDGELTTVKASGNPARFKRYDEKAQSWMTGEAQQIDYDAVKQTLIMTGQAKAEQPGKHLITGPKLVYDMQQQTLQANSTAEEKQRISVTLNPASKE
ncbi:lipopolysaccharide transport periplasmic protein LptA [Thiomicrorhabdus sediminis]|uniref:Lipopolysaccharide export system protein LptA n=1 Tax=Thiomicrorhabdus sediminis TaxID=2580412 RepID=A0A4P9K589_9GAMM|nr:lipopolysaccharide transport periplasmic protein LptA [Thiomicrorhabdus sediminis]QCU89610.1 lipopolysaccharide transport periplasmic protein LptA [Thiomicrorhabdus sediminis]